MAMQEIILCHGGNEYTLQHMSKTQLERNGHLPMSIAVSSGVLDAMKTVDDGVDGGVDGNGDKSTSSNDNE